MVVKTIHMQRL
jgi:hypothetical protein